MASRRVLMGSARRTLPPKLVLLARGEEGARGVPDGRSLPSSMRSARSWLPILSLMACQTAAASRASIR